MNTITLEELKAKYNHSHSVKDDSARGFKTVWIDEVQKGDKVILNNHFTLVI